MRLKNAQTVVDISDIQSASKNMCRHSHLGSIVCMMGNTHDSDISNKSLRLGLRYERYICVNCIRFAELLVCKGKGKHHHHNHNHSHQPYINHL